MTPDDLAAAGWAEDMHAGRDVLRTWTRGADEIDVWIQPNHPPQWVARRWLSPCPCCGHARRPFVRGASAPDIPTALAAAVAALDAHANSHAQEDVP